MGEEAVKVFWTNYPNTFAVVNYEEVRVINIYWRYMVLKKWRVNIHKWINIGYAIYWIHKIIIKHFIILNLLKVSLYLKMDESSSHNTLIKTYQQDNKLPKTYFDLIERVGTKGDYQKCLFLIFGLNWFITGFIVLQPVFLFLDPPFDCAAHGLLTNNCAKTVCEMETME